MKHALWVPYILGGLPLIVYPAVLLANVMSFAGHVSDEPVPLTLKLVSQGFLWSSTIYPFVFFACVRFSRRFFREQEFSKATVYSILPLLYLMIVAGLLYAWLQTGT